MRVKNSEFLIILEGEQSYMKKLLLFLILVALTITPVFADSSLLSDTTPFFTKDVLTKSNKMDIAIDLNTIQVLEGGNAIIVDHDGLMVNYVSIMDNKIIWSHKFERIYDLRVLSNPFKIVVITSEKNALKKVSLNEAGETVTLQRFPTLPAKDRKFGIPLSLSYTVRWIPPTSNSGERIAIMENDKVSFYKSPWKKAYSVNNVYVGPSSAYEEVDMRDWAVTYPYLVTKYSGHGLSRYETFYKIIDLTDKSSSEIRNIGDDFSLEKNSLIATSSTSDNPAINKPNAQPYYFQYSLKSKKLLSTQSKIFTESTLYGSISEHRLNYISLVDKGAGTLTIVREDGTTAIEHKMKADQAFLLNGNLKFLYYSESDKTAYYLTGDPLADYSQDKFVITSVTIP
jgi:hypothetical protein